MLKRWLLFAVAALLISAASLPALADEQPSKIERTTASGMSIMLQKNQSQVANIILLLKSGSGLDPAAKKGVATIMDNIVYWDLAYSPKTFGSVNVQTYPDYVLISLTALAGNIKPALEEIKFLLTEPIYSYDSVVDLKGIYYSRVKDLPGLNHSYEEFTKEFYGEAHPYNDWPSQETLQAITGVDVYQWYRQTYQPGNAILSITGNVNQNISDLVVFFSQMKTEQVDHHLLIQPVSLTANKQTNLDDLNSKAASLCIGFAAPRIKDPDYPAFKIICYYLSDFFDYFDEIRLKYGLFYSPAVFSNEFEKPGAPNFTLLSMTDPSHLNEVEAETLKIINRLMEQGIAQNEIDSVLKAMKARNDADKASGENSALLNALSYYLNTQLVYTDSLWPYLQQVKTDDIKRVASKYFKNYIQVAYIPQQIAKDF